MAPASPDWTRHSKSGCPSTRGIEWNSASICSTPRTTRTSEGSSETLEAASSGGSRAPYPAGRLNLACGTSSDRGRSDFTGSSGADLAASDLKPTAEDRWIAWPPQEKPRPLNLVTQHSRRHSPGARIPGSAGRDIRGSGTLCRDPTPARELALAGFTDRYARQPGASLAVMPPRPSQVDSIPVAPRNRAAACRDSYGSLGGRRQAIRIEGDRHSPLETSPRGRTLRLHKTWAKKATQSGTSSPSERIRLSVIHLDRQPLLQQS